MSDKMTGAPERLWADDGGWHWSSEGLANSAVEPDEVLTEYVRADLFAAMTAERDALRAALKSIERKSGPGWGVHMECIDIARKALGAS